MIAKCQCSAEAARKLREFAVMDSGEGPCVAEIEFREVPYFLVSRSREKWMEGRGDINVVRVINATSLGLVIDPASESVETQSAQASRHTMIPWANVISLTIDRA